MKLEKFCTHVAVQIYLLQLDLTVGLFYQIFSSAFEFFARIDGHRERALCIRSAPERGQLERDRNAYAP